MEKTKFESERENIYYMHENKKKIEEEIEWSNLKKTEKSNSSTEFNTTRRRHRGE
jgi:hypothetical protein